MSETSAQRLRARRACMQCRRKKTKCPAEKPVCSLCRRLGQPCSYTRESMDLSSRCRSTQDSSTSLERGTSEVHNFTSQSSYQLDSESRLETRLHRMEDALNLLLVRGSISSPVQRTSTSDLSAFASQDLPVATPEETGPLKFDVHRRPLPPIEVLSTLVNIYHENFETFLFCALDAEELNSRISSLPHNLLWSFLGLTARFSTHVFYDDAGGDMVEFYTNSARRILFTELIDPVWSLSTLQSFCLLCYSNIIDGKRSSAVQTLGIAAQYFTTLKPAQITDDVSRCMWALCFLELTYSTLTPLFPDRSALPEMPRSLADAGDPRLIDSHNNGVASASTRELGVGFHVASLLFTWRDIAASLGRAKSDRYEAAWVPSSTYRQVEYQMYQIECDFPEGHRFRLSRLVHRMSDEILSNKRYWDTWVLVQMLYHSIQTALNHPFVHLVLGPQHQRPPSFLQHVTDQAILHSQWVVHVLELCQHKGLEPTNPFVAHLAAVTATTHFFFCFAKDENISSKASKGFEVCRGFVSKMAGRWRNVRMMKLKLDRLALCLPATTQDRSSTKIAESLLWNLFDYAVSSSAGTEETEPSRSVEFDLTTQHLSPLNPQSTDAEQDRHEVMLPVASDTWAEEFSLDFLEMPDVSRWMLPADDWMGGQL